MKKRTLIIIIIAALLLVAGGVVAWLLWQRGKGSGESSNNQSSEKPRLVPNEDGIYEGGFDLEAGGSYMIVYDSDTAFAMVETLSSSAIEGVCYLVEKGSDCVVPQPFKLATRRHSSTLALGQEKEVAFEMGGDEFRECLDGGKHIVREKTGKNHTFSVRPYYAPEYAEVTDRRFKQELFRVETFRDVEFNVQKGYWATLTGNEADGYGKIIRSGISKSLKRRDVSLAMDIYLPQGENRDPTDSQTPVANGRPLILFLHGGAFYVGDKAEPHIAGWCRHFASMGYVTASANYRMGFMPTKKEIQKTGLDAAEDALDAVRFLKGRAAEYHIDTNMLFVAGTSAGSIIALDIAYAKDCDVKFRAVANMWGAVTDLDNLKNSRTDIVSFHGDADQLVPYDEGFPFSDIRNGKVGKALFDKMYGSKALSRKAVELGLRCKFYSFAGEGHALHLNADRSLNQKNYSFIQDSMAAFFYGEMVPREAKIEQDRFDARHFFVDHPMVRQVQWNVPRAFVLRQTEKEIWLVWPQTSVQRIVEASGHYENGIGFTCKTEI